MNKGDVVRIADRPGIPAMLRGVTVTVLSVLDDGRLYVFLPDADFEQNIEAAWVHGADAPDPVAPDPARAFFVKHFSADVEPPRFTLWLIRCYLWWNK